MAKKFKPCAVPGCKGNSHYSDHGARGWCNSHWLRWRRHGDPTAGRTPDGSLPAFVKLAIAYDKADACLIWPYSTTKGYGALMVEGKLQYAHRIVCAAVNGPPPTSAHQAAHSCGNGHLGCVNPHHLRWATQVENSADAIKHGASPKGERHGMSKLTEGQALRIISLKGKLTQQKVADEFGISREHVRDIQSGRSWGWLSP